MISQYCRSRHFLHAIMAGLLLVLLGLNQATATPTTVVLALASAAPMGADTLDEKQGASCATPDRLASDCVNDDMPLPPARHYWQVTRSSRGVIASDAYPLADVLLDTEPRPPSV
jgi:hypothetical protein